MISLTGKKKRRQGFTLVEVMVTTAVLAMGIVLVYQALFVCLEAFTYYANYVSVSGWMDEKVWEAQESLTRTGTLGLMDTAGTFVDQNREFAWSLSSRAADAAGGLYQIDLEVSWRAGRKQREMTRIAFALYEKE